MWYLSSGSCVVPWDHGHPGVGSLSLCPSPRLVSPLVGMVSYGFLGVPAKPNMLAKDACPLPFPWPCQSIMPSTGRGQGCAGGAGYSHARCVLAAGLARCFPHRFSTQRRALHGHPPILTPRKHVMWQINPKSLEQREQLTLVPITELIKHPSISGLMQWGTGKGREGGAMPAPNEVALPAPR